jgi:anti-sigma factor RsiW
MSEHAWVLENLAGFCAGGLEAAERERLETHTAGCDACGRALAKARAFDRSLDALFTDVRPTPLFEDRLIQSLRTRRSRRGSARWLGWVAAVAALVVLGVVGAGLTHVAAKGSLPFPGMAWAEVGDESAMAMNNLKAAKNVALGDGAKAAQSQFNSAIDYSGVEGMAKEVRDRALADIGDNLIDGAQQPVISSSDVSRNGDARYKSVDRPDEGWAYGSVDGKNAADGTRMASPAPAARSESGKGAGRSSGIDTYVIDQLKSDKGKDFTYRSDAGAAGVGGGGGGGGMPGYGMYGTPPAGASGPGGPFSGGTATSPGGVSVSAGAPPGGQGMRGLSTGAQPGDKTIAIRGFSDVDGSIQQSIKSINTPPTVHYFVPQDALGNVLRPVERNKAEGKEDQKELKNLVPAATPAPESVEAPKPIPPAGSEKDVESKAFKLRTGANAERKANQDLVAVAQEPKPEPAASARKIIRSGDIEFEIESFDAAVATVTKLLGSYKGGFVATVNSEKMQNGKVKGSVVVRMPPEHLDSYVLDLRKELGKGGELKGQRIGSQDITKQYTDLESRLRAALAMEERLLRIIKDGKGEIKDLLNAEKELGNWRTKIEEYKGELQYYSNQVSLSTLTITLAEKEIRAPFAMLETERVNMGVEAEDVDKTYREALAAVTAAKGRVTKSELKQLAAGQYSALIHFEVAPEAAGPMRDRFKQLGNVARMEIDHLTQPEGGSGPAENAKTKRKDTQFFVSIYNLANVQPRETITVTLAASDVEAAYKTVLARANKAAARILTSVLSQQRNDSTTGSLQFEVKTAEADAVLTDLKLAGDVLNVQTNEAADTQNVTKSKRGFHVSVISLGQVQPRETHTLTLASRDVPAAYKTLVETANKAKARITRAQLDEQNKQNIRGDLSFDFRRTDEGDIENAAKSVGDIFSRTVARTQDGVNVLDSLVRWNLSILNVNNIPPRETVVLAIEVGNVETTANAFANLVGESKGRVVESHVAHERSGRITAKLLYDVPLATASGLVEKFRSSGTVRVLETSRNPQVPDSELAVARLNVTLSNAELIVPSDEGVWPQVRKGLSWSFRLLLLSLSWLIVALCAVGPWVALGYIVYRVVLRMRRREAAPVTTPAA